MSKQPYTRRQLLKTAAAFAVAPTLLPSPVVAADAKAARAAAAARAKAAVAAPSRGDGTVCQASGAGLAPDIGIPVPLPDRGQGSPLGGEEHLQPFRRGSANGRAHLLYRADDANPQSSWGRTCRIGLAISDDGIHFTRHTEPVLHPDNDEFKKYEWAGGCEDLHVVEGADGVYYMNYTPTPAGIRASGHDVRGQFAGPCAVDQARPGFSKLSPEQVNGSAVWGGGFPARGRPPHRRQD